MKGIKRLLGCLIGISGLLLSMHACVNGTNCTTSISQTLMWVAIAWLMMVIGYAVYYSGKEEKGSKGPRNQESHIKNNT